MPNLKHRAVAVSTFAPYRISRQPQANRPASDCNVAETGGLKAKWSRRKEHRRLQIIHM